MSEKDSITLVEAIECCMAYVYRPDESKSYYYPFEQKLMDCIDIVEQWIEEQHGDEREDIQA